MQFNNFVDIALGQIGNLSEGEGYPQEQHWKDTSRKRYQILALDLLPAKLCPIKYVNLLS